MPSQSTGRAQAVPERAPVPSRIAREIPTHRRYRTRQQMAGKGPAGDGRPALSPDTDVDSATAATEPNQPPDPAEALPAETQVGRYVIRDVIGSGSISVVYRANDPELDREIALKLLRVSESRQRTSSTRRARLLREAQALAQLSHPNVIAIYDVGTHEGDVFIAMELIEGYSLAQWLRTARSPQQVIDVFMAAGRGLAAAHAAGLVHRDVKPHNIVIGRTGRVCVVDFGLARALGGDTSSDPTSPQVAALDTTSAANSFEPNLTETGSLVGTPAYMAPEQFLCQPAGPAADQFSFCAALFEALAGHRPFTGHNLAAIRYEVLSGAPIAWPPRSRMPRHVRRALRRGLARLPADRFPAMTELLDELGRAPLWARPIRAAAVIAAMLAVTVAAVAAIWALQTWSAAAERQARERAATTRLAAVERQIEQLRTDNRLAEADALFYGFARSPENRDTAALTQAWLRRAVRRTGEDEELAAYAAAYATASTAALQRAALLGLARGFAARGDWPRMDNVARTLRRHDPTDQLSRQVGPLEIASALARRDLLHFAALSRAQRNAGSDGAAPVITSLGRGQPTAFVGGNARRVDLDGDGTDEVFVHDPVRGFIAAVRAEPQLGVIWRADVPADFGELLAIWPLSMDRGGQAHLVGWVQQLGGARHGAVFRVRKRGLQVLDRWPENQVNFARSLELGGRKRHLVGMGPYTRELFEVVNEGGHSSLVPMPSVTRGAGSDIIAAIAADVDGDRQPELVVSIGPWRAFDVRVMRPVGDSFELVARRKLGFVAALAALPGRNGTRIVALKDNRAPSAEVFPEPSPYGSPPGLYVLRVDGDELVTDQFLPIAGPIGSEPTQLHSLVAADLDGDGLVDLAASASSPTSPDTLHLFRQMPDSSFAAASIGSVTLLDAVEVDGDAASELLVRLPDQQGRMWILGAGSDLLPQAATPPPPQPPPSGPAPPAVAARPGAYRLWRRAQDLVAMQLFNQAAQVFEDLASIADANVAPLAQLNAARLWDSLGDDARSGPLYEAAARSPTLAADALGAAAAAYIREHQFADALRVTRTEVDLADQPASAVARASERLARLTPLVHDLDEVTLPFDQPLRRPWVIDDPLALRRDARAKALHVSALVRNRPIARVPVRWTGERIVMSATFQIDRSEWASGVRIALRSDRGSPDDGLGFATMTWGGGGLLRRQVGCAVPGRLGIVGPSWPLAGPDTPTTVRATISVAPGLGELSCRIEAEGRAPYHLRAPLRHIPPRGSYWLTIESGGEEPIAAPLLTAIRLHDVHIRGARLGSGQADPPLATGNLHLVESDAAAALAAYGGAGAGSVGEDEQGVANLWRALALAQLGQTDQSAGLISQVLASAHLRGGAALTTTRAALATLLRIHGHVITPAARQALGPGFFAEYYTAWRGVLTAHEHDPLVEQSLTSALYGLQAVAPGRIGRDGLAAKATLLAASGGAAWRRGASAQAVADLTTAAELAARGLRRTDWTGDYSPRDLLSRINRDLARVAASSGDRTRALAHIRLAIEQSESPELAADLLFLHPELAGLRQFIDR
jgi:predicted Ser/Thr protein kinase